MRCILTCKCYFCMCTNLYSHFQTIIYDNSVLTELEKHIHIQRETTNLVGASCVLLVLLHRRKLSVLYSHEGCIHLLCCIIVLIIQLQDWSNKRSFTLASSLHAQEATSDTFISHVNDFKKS